MAVGPWAPQASATRATPGSLTMESDAGDYIGQGAFYLNVACSGTTPWEATVTAFNGDPFIPGKAALDVDATGYDTAYGRHPKVTTTATVRLTGGVTP